MRVINVLHSLTPVNCMGCNAVGGYICDSCQMSLGRSKTADCYSCNRLSVGGRTCDRCRRQSNLEGITVARYYDGLVKQLIQKLKFRSAIELAEIGANLMFPALPESEFDFVVPVPSVASRLRERGYNPAAALARRLAQELSLPYLQALGRLGRSHQVGHGRQERLLAVQGQMYAKQSRLLREARILLVDDVVTTGATMNEAARALREVGAVSVWGVVLAKH